MSSSTGEAPTMGSIIDDCRHHCAADEREGPAVRPEHRLYHRHPFRQAGLRPLVLGVPGGWVDRVEPSLDQPASAASSWARSSLAVGVTAQEIRGPAFRTDSGTPEANC